MRFVNKSAIYCCLQRAALLFLCLSLPAISFSQNPESEISDTNQMELKDSNDNESKNDNLAVKIGKKIISIPKFIFSNKITTDTNFVARPEQPLTLKFRCDVKNNLAIYDYGKEKGSNGYLDNDWIATFGFGINYRGLSISLGGNPSKWFKWNEDKEIGINLYNNRFGIDASYYRLKDLYDYSSFSKWWKQDYDIHYPDAETEGWNVNLYYVFNNKRFSYPAAFSQTWVQKHSAGSFIASATYNQRDISTPINGLLGDYEEHSELYSSYEEYLAMNQMKENIKTRYLALGVGYAYNFVPSRHWLIHISAVPSFMVTKQYDLQMLSSNDSCLMSIDCSSKFDYAINVRTSAIYSWKKYFAGVTGIYSIDVVGRKDEDLMSYMRWKLRFVFGLRLNFDPISKIMKK